MTACRVTKNRVVFACSGRVLTPGVLPWWFDYQRVVVVEFVFDAGFGDPYRDVVAGGDAEALHEFRRDAEV